MTIDLKALTNEIIHKMGYSTHDLWVIKLKDEVFGPFEVDSLKHYAIENEQLFQEALASRMDTNDWHPFYSYAQFTEIGEHAHAQQEQIQKFWILQNGQKLGPHSYFDIQKKLEMNILGLNELVSIDDGHTWKKFYQLASFQNLLKNADSLPICPSEQEFNYAKEEVAEMIGVGESSETFNGLAALAYLGSKKEGPQINLDEIDLKLLNQTEVSRSLKWAAPAMAASVLLIVGVVTLLNTKGTELDLTSQNEVNQTERDLPKTSQNSESNKAMPRRRQPASYQPAHHNRSALTQAPPIHHEPYQGHNESLSHEPEPPMDQPMESEPEPVQDPGSEHSLVSNTPNGQEGGESLDQAMSMTEPAPQPETPPVEESGDF